MATIAAMMAVAATRVQPLKVGSRSVARSRISRSAATPRSKRFVQVRCMADLEVANFSMTRGRFCLLSQPNQNSESTRRPVDGVKPASPSSTTPPSTPAAVPKRKVSTSFEDVFAFNGPAPETINGRLAMLGFVAALGFELNTGDGILTQISNGGIWWFVLSTSIITYASLVPMFKGVTAASKSNGIWTAQAETWNGRAAMIGIVALAITEYLTGNPLI